MHIAIFCPNWVGDVVMATPTMRAVRDGFPDAKITAVLRPYVQDILAGLPLVDATLAHDPRGKNGLSGWAFARALRQQKFDMAILLPNSFRSAWWAWLSGAKRRIGLDRSARGWLLTDRVPGASQATPHPVMDDYALLASHLGFTVTRQMELATTATDEQQLAAFWRTQPASLTGLETTEFPRYVALNPGGAFGAAKHWPVSSFAALAAKLARDGERVLVLCGPSERNDAREIVRVAQEKVGGDRRFSICSLADAVPSLGLTKAAVRHAALLVTTDSGPRHFAAPFGVSVVTLFGPTHIAWSETYSGGVHLQIPIDCGPCQQRTCPLKHHRCMRDLSVDQVHATARHLLATTLLRAG